MRDFMPCAGCDEPEACEIEGRCLEPAVRMLSSEELADCCGGCHTSSAIETWMRRAIERFCAVNGITLAAGVQGMDGWRPIATAPKDGTRYLAANEQFQTILNQPPNHYPGDWTLIDGEWCGSATGFAATHWKPLDPLPSASGVLGTSNNQGENHG